MSNKNTTLGHPKKSRVLPTATGNGSFAGAKPPAPEAVNLKLDDNDDFGGDPYNHTGSHCVIKTRDDA